MKTLYLFPDTNVFLQCKSLEEVDWCVLGEWDRIEVFLTRPVQTEIDALKGGGNHRRATRARGASTLIRKLLNAEGGRQTVREQPLVELCLRQDLRRDEAASGDLNYDERDDQLVGIALAFQKSNPSVPVRLLTNDTGPMASAKAVGLGYQELPDEWLLPREVDEATKRENELKAEIARYKRLEPSFDIEFLCLDERHLKASLQMYRALSSREVDELLARLADKFPLCSDFGVSEAQERVTERLLEPFGFRVREVFQPATPEEISAYRKSYEAWKQECAEKLSNLHTALHRRQAWPQIRVSIINVGSRPADDALFIANVQGKIALRPPRRDEDDSDQRKHDDVVGLRLSPAPTAPKGRWNRTDPFTGSGMLSNLTRMFEPRGDFRMVVPPGPSVFRRDANALYLKEGSRGVPSQRIEYECAQWRHQQSAEVLEFDVLCALKPGHHSGSVRMEMHAANLTTPESAQLPITLSVEESSCLEIAQQMVAALGA